MEIYTVKEAAQSLGLSQSQVKFLLSKGEIEGKKFGKMWMVTSLEYKRKRKPKGGK